MSGEHGPAYAGSRDVLVLTARGRAALLLGALFLIAAAVVYWLPLEQQVPPLPPVHCGSAASPPVDPATVTVCGVMPDRQRWVAGGLFVAGTLVALGGVLAFGTERRTQLLPAGARRGRADDRTSAEPTDDPQG